MIIRRAVVSSHQARNALSRAELRVYRLGCRLPNGENPLIALGVVRPTCVQELRSTPLSGETDAGLDTRRPPGARGRQHLEQAIALYDPARHQSLAFTYSLNPRVSALVTLGLTLQYLGFPDQASRAGDQGVEEAKQSGHFNTLGVALHLAGRLRAFQRDGVQLRILASQLITLSREQGATDWQLAGEILLAWQNAREGALEQGLEAVRRGVDGLRARNLNVWLPVYLLMHAEICCKAGRFDEALQLLDETMELMQLQDHPVCEAELHRLRACTEFSRGANVSVVEASFDRALDVARRQRTKFWELRAAISRARFWRDRGMRTEASALLAPLYDWFTEGFDALDLKEAKALLDELAQ
jgi:predicted ATPase